MPFDDNAIDDVLDPRQLFGGDSTVVRKIEAQLVGSNGGALLTHVIAKHLLQRPMQHVRARVVRGRWAAAVRVNERAYLLPIRQRAAFDHHDQGLITVEANHLNDRCTTSVGFDRTGIRNLSTTLRVERRLAQLDRQAPLAEVV